MSNKLTEVDSVQPYRVINGNLLRSILKLLIHCLYSEHIFIFRVVSSQPSSFSIVLIHLN